MSLAWSNKAKFTPCERKVLAWANAGAQFPLESLTDEQIAVIAGMEQRKLVLTKMSGGVGVRGTPTTITFIETEMGRLAAMQSFMSPEQVANERIRISRYENEALF